MNGNVVRSKPLGSNPDSLMCCREKVRYFDRAGYWFWLLNNIAVEEGVRGVRYELERAKSILKKFHGKKWIRVTTGSWEKTEEQIREKLQYVQDNLENYPQNPEVFHRLCTAYAYLNVMQEFSKQLNKVMCGDF